MTRCFVLAALLTVASAALCAPEAPQPRVFGIYSSWLQGSYRYRDTQAPLFSKLGWAYDHRENTEIAALMADLDRYDIFCPVGVYNYDHPQPLEQYKAQWQAFLQRGGILIALDANYGQQMGWVSQLGEGLELQAAQCPEGMKGQPPVKITAPDDPAAPPTSAKTPWAHFVSWGKGWKVLATCPEGNAVCLRADIGKGILIATNLYDDTGYPTAEYLERLWQAQWPKLMPKDLAVEVDRGPAGVGRKAITVKLGAALDGRLLLETRDGAAGWHTQTVALPGPGATASLPVSVSSGTTDFRLVAEANGQRTWWTGWTETIPDVTATATALRERLAALGEVLKPIPLNHPLRAATQTLVEAQAQVAGEAQQLLKAEANAHTTERWQGLATQLDTLEAQRQTVAGRAAVAGQVAGDKAFAVVRSQPLEKVFRDEAPSGPVVGGVNLRAARGEAESVQVALVPLRGDLTGVRVRLEPFVGADRKPLKLDSELHRVGYVHLAAPSSGVPAGRTWWPDVLLPADQPFGVKHVAQPLWLDLWTPRDSEAGRYSGALVIEAAGQTERVPLTLEVLDFTLPKEHSLRQTFIFRAPQVTQRYNGQADYKTATSVDTYLKMMDVCLKRRVGVQAFGWEGSPTPVSAMAYMGETKTADGWQFDFTQADRLWQHQWDSGMRTLFVGFTPGCGSVYGPVGTEAYWTFLEAYLKALVPHLKAKGWYEAAVWYMVDECWNDDAVQANLRVAELMDRVAPGLKRLMTAPRDARLYGKSQIWVPGGLPEASANEPANKALLEGWKPFNPERWWYICCGPVHPYPNFFADYPTVDMRTVFWLTWKYHKTGFLYWGVEYFGDPREMTPDGPTEKYTLGPANMGNGDGTLCYWAPNETFYPSIRLNAIRDGIEDYECFALASELADQAEEAGKAPDVVARTRRVLAVSQRVIEDTDASPNFQYSLDSANLLAARRELDDCILTLRKALER